DIRGDPVEPRAQQRVRVEAVPGPPGPQQRLLHSVLGFVERGQHAVAVQVQFAPVAFGTLREIGADLSRHCCGWAGPTSWTGQPLPSGSLNEANELYLPRSGSGPGT